MNPILADLGCPLVFRTVDTDVYRATLETGSLWLRSDAYYRVLEDGVRNDHHEGVNCTKGGLPMRFPPLFEGIDLTIDGPGSIGQAIVPHYIASFHSTSIAEEQRHQFGGHTFGVRNWARLAAEIQYRCSLQLPVTWYRFGQVIYQHAALARTIHPTGGPAIRIDGRPATFVNPIDTDVLRKRPAMPFIDQDEWRIAIFTPGYLDNDPMTPLRIEVSPSNFYPSLDRERPRLL